MSKKIIALIVCVLILIGVGVAIFMVSNGGNQENNQNTNLAQTGNSNNSNISNNEEENNNQEQTANQTANNEEQENNETTSNGKVLVLYFSQSGNTETVANFIHDAVGGDIVKLETEQTYPSDYNELVDYAQEEQNNNARPALKTIIDIDQYDVIFLGYPNWWGDMPMPLYTFLDEYDLSGKTIAPFITHGGSGLSGTPNKIKQEEPNATVTEGLAISGSSASSSKSTVENWLSKIGF